MFEIRHKQTSSWATCGNPQNGWKVGGFGLAERSLTINWCKGKVFAHNTTCVVMLFIVYLVSFIVDCVRKLYRLVRLEGFFLCVDIFNI